MRTRVFGVALSVCLFGAALSAAQEEGEGGGAKVGPGKAVTEADAKDGMKLSEAAIKRLGIVFQDAARGAVQELPAESLVLSREETAVYRLRGGWIKRVEVRVQARSPKKVTVQSRDLRPGDRIAVAGAPFLRMAELDVFGSGDEGNDEH
jgi:multidrug efflux pump subunit AcrA (membrane-fusion protein)